jgi:uncharacterized protein YfaS (alpha-2-macroglobulin family)
MKMIRVLLPVVYPVLLLGVFVSLSLGYPIQQSRTDAWKKVREAMSQGLPKTAIEELKPIIESTLAEKKYAEATKAIGMRVVLEAQIEGMKPEEHIIRLQREIDKAPKEMQPIMNALQAHFYWNYFQQNRWRFGQRTTTSVSPSDDIQTWDLRRIFQEIDNKYRLALEKESELLAIPIESWDALLVSGTLPDSYRPTLFDFIANEALDFYAAGEQAGAKAEDSFDLEASSAILGSNEDFLEWNPQSSDEQSPKLKTIRLLKRLMAIHRDDSDRTAFLDTELRRLQFGFNESVGEEKRDRTIAGLKSFADKNSRHELSAMARYRWASLLVETEDRVEARAIAQQAVNAFPMSPGGRQCAALISAIEAKELSVVTERVWGDPKSEIRVSYRNLNKVYFRLHSLNWRERISQTNNSPSYPQQIDRDRLAQSPPTYAWAADLPATDDYNPATQDVRVLDNLKPGFYFLQASSKEDFSESGNVIAVTTVWVSNLALVVDQSNGDGKVDGFVLDNQSGLPVVGAKVSAIVQDNRNRNNVTEQSTTTNNDGRFQFAIVDKPFLLIAEHQGNQLAVKDMLYSYAAQPTPPAQVGYTVFTDRSIYRPGQSIQFKGICLFADTIHDKYQTVPKHTVVVSFRDINGNEITNQTLVSNDFGSFHGSFIAPRDRGTGSMVLMFNSGHVHAVQVEEYKRPKFEVKLESPTESPKLMEAVTIAGKALSYTGSAVQGGKVRYRVTRSVRWPVWFTICFPWRIPPTQGASQEIAHGIATTDNEGQFTIEFPAKPDRSVPESDSPIFQFSVNAEVTDSTGETRVANTSVAIGYVAMQAEVSSAEWLTTEKPIEFRIDTSTLNGQPVASKGQFKVYRLKEPSQILRTDILGNALTPIQRRPPNNRPRPSNPGVPSGARSGFVKRTPIPDLSQIQQWDVDTLVAERPFEFGADAEKKIAVELPRGVFRAVLESQDRFGKPITAQFNFKVIDLSKTDLGIRVANHVTAEKWSLEPGESLRAIWGTGYDKGRAFVDILQNGKSIRSYWTKPEATQVVIEQPITEDMRGGLTMRVLFVRENRSYIESRQVEVPWSNKDLKLRWERMVSKMEPGVKERLKLVVEGPKASKAVAEMVAAMYDASLDAFRPHAWISKLDVFRRNNRWATWSFLNHQEYLMPFRGAFDTVHSVAPPTYRQFPPELHAQPMPVLYGGMPGDPRVMSLGAPGGARNVMRGSGGLEGGGFGGMPGPPMAMAAEGMAMDAAVDKMAKSNGEAGGVKSAAASIDLGTITARKNLAETAFFVPVVKQSTDGSYEIEFTVPEALTTWRVMAFAHDKELKSGYLDAKLTTSKDLMVQPNPPRFLREGDTLDFSVKVTNSSKESQNGKVAFKLLDAISERSVDAEFGNATTEQSFQLEAGESKAFSWRLNVPDGAYPIIYKAIGGTNRSSDGEEGMLPVLSKRVLVTESLPLPIRGNTTKDFEFRKLLESGSSDSLKHQSLTVQMVSQPSWYAVLALPYLMEYPYPCSEQIFNRLYANSLARHIAKSDPKIRKVFDVWRNFQPDTLTSPLQKNEDLKTVLIEETPWLRDAQQETEARRNVGLLFEENRLSGEVSRAIQQLTEMQHENGMWPWFPGGRDNEYLTLYIVTGFGRLKHLGVEIDRSLAIKAVTRLDAWVREMYDTIVRESNPEKDHLSSVIALYLYGRSFYMDEVPIAENHQVAVDFWKRQAREYWLRQPRQCQAQIALGLHRMKDERTPDAIVKSLLEHATSNEEMGMFWNDGGQAWWWYHAPIETQAMMIEVFDEVAHNQRVVEDCKVWLLKQKQTQNWKTTKSTADAVYALLLRGANMLASDALVEVQLAGKRLEPARVEAGTGFYEQKFLRTEVIPEFGKIRLTKTDPGVSWGSIYWQYLEDVSKVTPHEGTPLKLEKQIYRKEFTKAGPELQPVNGPLQIGDELVCRIVLRTDRDMEYVHLKDHRGSGTEPVNVISTYRFQDGLGYYESTRDTASHFFMDYLPKGTYVFEYSVRVQHAGKYPTGIANIECMYAPEFNSHSGSIPLDVTPR